VMNVADDPVEMGLIESFARPGGNITGYTGIGAELSGKRLEILKEAFPKVARVGHLWTGLSGMANVREIEAPARGSPAKRLKRGCRLSTPIRNLLSTAG
jgi:ABC-type uncharacterized transport system substrate-binding protein